MLRRPSFCQPTLRGEGCSSTAIGEFSPVPGMAWNNPAGRGSMPGTGENSPAVP
ncbi:hypothetical protein FTUN_0311 [Frigoriglobus tundricola]|uniref:Uncharacterized protein n=1 Tax=Frigoriglobus tundricola TaxID=2774151 RepID=A0A6M5YGU9_9BACT|nr:hypothetical protein FTUN_0311 [Frigoriglobus tundricola]